MAGYIKGGIIAGIILFIWGVLSWMVLPWHMMTLHSFNDEKTVSELVVSNTPESGIYVLPMRQAQSTEQAEQTAPQAFIFAAVNTQGMPASMTMPMLIGLISQIIAAIIVGWMLSHTTGFSYAGRVVFAMAFAIAAGIVTHGAYWNWFTFDTKYTLVEMADLLIGWFFAGLILAKFSHSR